MTRLNLTQIKLPNTICIQEQENTQKQKLSSEEGTTGDGACRTRAGTGRSPTAAEHHKPPNATKHGKRDGTWPSRAAQGVKNTLARGHRRAFWP
jgi:hypothetical protein